MRVMNLKQEEFRNLMQENRSLKEYMDDFQALSRYASKDIDTDGKRKAKFLKGLSNELKIPLLVSYAPNYQALLDQAIILEDGIKKAENRKMRLGINKHHSEPSFKKPFSHDGHRHSGGSNHHSGNNHHGGSSHIPHGHNHNGGFREIIQDTGEMDMLAIIITMDNLVPILNSRKTSVKCSASSATTKGILQMNA